MFKYSIASVLLVVFLAYSGSVYAADSEKRSKPVKITSDNFKQEIANGIVLVDFWAAWCAPCRKLSPVLNQIAKEGKLDIKIGKINVDSNKPFAINMGVRTLPTMILYKDGKEITRFSGFYSKEDLEEVIANALK